MVTNGKHAAGVLSLGSLKAKNVALFIFYNLGDKNWIFTDLKVIFKQFKNVLNHKKIISIAFFSLF